MIPGINSFMFQGFSIEKIFDIASQIGCNHISVGIEDLYNKELLGLTQKYKISIHAVGSLFLDVDNLPESISSGKAILDLCAIQRISMLVVVIKSGSDGYGWMKNTVILLQKLCDYAAKKQIVVGIEPLSPRMRSFSCLTHIHTARIICNYVDRKNIGVIVDTFHCGYMDNVERELASSDLRVVGIHLSDRDEEGNACFPGDGILPLKKWLDLISSRKKGCVTELEIVNNQLIKKSIDNSAIFKKSFLQYSNIAVIGELAIHLFKDAEGNVEDAILGGGAGMIASQLSCLHDFPYLIGICGDDYWGDCIRNNYSDCIGWADMVQQENGRTSVVSICDDDISIVTGNINVKNLEKCLLGMVDKIQFCYLPMFPGYECIYRFLQEKDEVKLICDFGFFDWCGDKRVLCDKIASTSGGYCALINAKNMNSNEKKYILQYAINNGFQNAIATDGKQNVLLATGKVIEEYPVFGVNTIGTTCGAGDCMVAGILHMLGKGYSIEEAVCFGIYVAYQKVQLLGVWEQTDRR